MTEDGANYPEGLTPGERRVLDYVREGTLDAEIGVRLGIPVGEVKDRVGRIVHKLGLRDRRELVEATAGQPPPPSAAAPAWTWARPGTEVIDFTLPSGPEQSARAHAEPEFIIDFTGEPDVGQPNRRRWFFASVATFLLAVTAASAVLAFGPGDSGDHYTAPGAALVKDDPEVNIQALDPTTLAILKGVLSEVSAGAIDRTDDPTLPLATRPAATSTTPAPPALITDTAIKDLPPNTVLYVETGCANCDASPDSIVRVWARANGTYDVTTVFSPHRNPAGEPFQITGIAVGPGGQEMVVGVCGPGSCLPSGALATGVQTTIHRTTNGGASWSLLESTYGPWSPVLVDDEELLGKDGVMLERLSPSPTEARYLILPAREDLRYPPHAKSRVFSVGAWQTDSWNVVGFDGATIAPGAVEFLTYWVEQTVEREWIAIGNSELRVLQFPGTTSIPFRQTRFQLVDRHILGVARADVGIRLDRIFASVSPNSSVSMTIGSALPNIHELGTWPAWIDTSSRVVTYIAKPFTDMPAGRNRILASATGRFVRVHDTGDCLNIRREPTAISPILDCVFDGALLKLRAVPGPAAGYTAISYGPADAAAWVTSAYVED